MQQAGAGLPTSLVFHAIALVVLGHVAYKAAGPPAEAPRPNVVWLGAWDQHAARGSQNGTSLADSELAAPAPGESAAPPPAPLPAAVPEPTAPLPAAAPEAPDASGASTGSGPGIALDWSEERRRAIEDLLADRERAASYRSFSFPGTVGEEEAAAAREQQRAIEAGLAPARSAFDSPAKGRAGLAETSPLGERIVWVSDECYSRSGSNNGSLLPSAAALFEVPSTTCVRVNPRDDLFWSAKPRYRMTSVEYSDRARRLALEDDATGAVATFGD